MQSCLPVCSVIIINYQSNELGAPTKGRSLLRGTLRLLEMQKIIVVVCRKPSQSPQARPSQGRGVPWEPRSTKESGTSLTRIIGVAVADMVDGPGVSRSAFRPECLRGSSHQAIMLHDSLTPL